MTISDMSESMQLLRRNSAKYDYLSVELPTEKISLCQWRKIISTICIGILYFESGFLLTMVGPLLLDLKEQTHSNMAEISFVYLSRSVGFLGGCLMAICVLKTRIRLAIVLFGVLVIISCTLIPQYETVWPMIALFGVQAFGLGAYQTVFPSIVFAIWSDGSRAAIFQVLSAALVIGTALPPPVSAPFLRQENNNGTSDETSYNISTTDTVDTNEGNLSPLFHGVSLFTLLAVIAALAANQWCFRFTIDKSDDDDKPRDECGSEVSRSRLWLYFAISLVLAFSISSSFAVNASLILPYVVTRLHETKSMGVVVSTIFAGASISSAVLVSFSMKFFSPSANLHGLLCFHVLGAIVYTVGRDSLVGVIIAQVLLGIGTGVSIGPVMCWAHAITKSHLIVFSLCTLVGGNIGEILSPFFGGLLFHLNPITLLFWSVVMSLIGLIVFILGQYVIRPSRNQRELT